MIVSEIKRVTFWGLLAVMAVSVFPSNSSAAAASSAANSGYALVGDDDDKGKVKHQDKHKDKHKDKGGRGHGRKGGDDDRGERRDDRGSWGRQRGDDDDRGSRDQRWNDDRRSRRGDNRQVYQVPQTWTQWFPGSDQDYRNHGQRVSAERHRRNDERKRYKEVRKEQKRYDREQRRYSDGHYNYNNGNVYNDNVYQPRRSGIKQQLLQTVIGGLLGGGRLGGLERLIPNRGNAGQYQPNYTYSPRYAQPQYQGQQYYSPGYSPMFSDAYNDNRYSRSNGSGIGRILQALPLAAIIQQYTGGNNFLSSIVSNSVLGSDSGFGDMGYNNVGYSDVGYNDIEYNDPNFGGDIYDQRSNGTADLISVLLSNVLSGV